MSLPCKRGWRRSRKSRSIIFVIDAGMVEYNVHEAALANRSQLLDKVLSEVMGCANPMVFWKDFDVDTFAKFLDYIYKGNYNIVDPKHCSEGDAASASALPETGASHSRDYYMAHSSLYLLAHRYGPDELMSLCIENMRQSLVRNPCQGELVYAVVDVLRAVWPRTRSDDAMTNLVLQYILTDMSWMMNQPPLIKLLDEIPEVAPKLLLLIPTPYWDAL
ncbi:hypothetical protein LZ30DRAFT_772766 [Colletotrichum cereale]|nr:hypothetical protein LZ30DRAFT_772766 [Colletotrichum cereale]